MQIFIFEKTIRLPHLPNTDLFEPDCFYPIFNHAVGNENLFRNNDNFHYFLTKFKQYIAPVCKVYAYCLMPNHFHFLVQIRSKEEIALFYKTLKPNAADANLDYHKIVMHQYSKLFNGYAQAYNKMYSRKGALFIDYLRRKQITDSSYFTKLVQYIHNNPIHHNFCKNIEDWIYSSYHTILSNKPTLIERNEIIHWFNSIEQFKQLHQQSIPFLLEIEY